VQYRQSSEEPSMIMNNTRDVDRNYEQLHREFKQHHGQDGSSSRRRLHVREVSFQQINRGV